MKASSPSPLHSSGDAYRLTALFVGCAYPICALLTTCQAGASAVRRRPPGAVQRGVPPRAARGSRGFTLIELLMVVAIIGIITAIAAPGLMNARRSALEISAIGSLRAINSAQATFAASCGNGFYAPSLALLATPPTAGGGEGFIGTDLASDPSMKSSYSVALTAGPAAQGAPPSCNGIPAGGVVASYFVGASPAAGGGVRHFGTNQGGTIYQSTAPLAVTQTGAPAGATPIQ